MAVQLSLAGLSLTERWRQAGVSSAEKDEQTSFQCHDPLSPHYPLLRIVNDLRKKEKDSLSEFYTDFRDFFDKLPLAMRRVEVESIYNFRFSCKDLSLSKEAAGEASFWVIEASSFTVPGISLPLPPPRFIQHNNLAFATIVCEHCEKIEAVAKPILLKYLGEDASVIALDYLFVKMRTDRSST
jgi:hypothetical protein